MSDILGDFLRDAFPVTGKTVSKADAMLARSDKGLCLTLSCLRLADDEDGLCLWCRRAAKEK